MKFFLLLIPLALAIDFEQNLEPSLKDSILQDLKDIASLKGGAGSPLHKEIFGHDTIEGTHYRDFIEARIKTIGMDAAEDRPGGLAYFDTQNKESKRMFFTSQYVNQSLPQAFRLSLLVHEARHSEAENNFWGHTVCPKPFTGKNGKDIRKFGSDRLAATKSCDESHLASNGTQVVFLRNLHKRCTSCSEKFMMDSQIFGEGFAIRVIEGNDLLEADYKSLD